MGEFTGMFEFFRGAGRIYGAIKSVSQYFRALLNIFARCSIFSGLISILPGSSQYFRGVLKTYGHTAINYGDMFIISGNVKIVYQVPGTNYNLRGIFPHMDRHSPHL